MGFLQSPGIVSTEIDLTTIVPGVSTSVAAIGGVFQWGPVEDADLISNENELIARFGKPTESNFETWYSAADFLAYADSLYVSRAADANCYNAVANTGAVANTQIKNDTHFVQVYDSLSANATFYARYPGDLGNTLKVSVCDSSKAFNSTIAAANGTYTIALDFVVNSNTATLVVTGANTSVAQTLSTDILASISVGDHLIASSTTIGTQPIKIVAIGATTAANNAATTVFGLGSRFHLSANVSMNTFQRAWEYFDLVDVAPDTSLYTEARGGSGDELHIVVIDEDGKFSGIPGSPLEIWSNLSRATDGEREQGGSAYYKDVINNSSRYVYVRGVTATSNTAANIVPLTTIPQTYSLTGGTNSQTESAISLSDLARAYDVYKNKDETDVSIIITGKAVHGTHGEGLANYITDNIVSLRKDCVQVMSPHISDVVNNPFQEAEAIVQFRHALRKSSYSILDSGYKRLYDRHNDKFRWVPLNGDIAGLIARTDVDRDPWWSPAGHNRGVLKNLITLAYNPDQTDRDLLYKNDINSVITVRGSGTILYGDKTLLGKASAFDRINVRRLFIFLEKAIERAAKDLLFEFNDPFTRARFRNMVEPFLRDVQGRRGVTAFRVVCDETNNTGTVVDRNEFIGDIYIKPARSINFIKLNFVAVNTDVDFNTVIGQW